VRAACRDAVRCMELILRFDLSRVFDIVKGDMLILIEEEYSQLTGKDVLLDMVFDLLVLDRLGDQPVALIYDQGVVEALRAVHGAGRTAEEVPSISEKTIRTNPYIKGQSVIQLGRVRQSRTPRCPEDWTAEQRAGLLMDGAVALNNSPHGFRQPPPLDSRWQPPDRSNPPPAAPR
jgi:hypothetical protein